MGQRMGQHDEIDRRPDWKPGHTSAALMVAAGANAKVIQSCLGHASIPMTFDHYGHLMAGGEAEAARLAGIGSETELR